MLHTEADGSLAKPALEALGTAAQLWRAALPGLDARWPVSSAQTQAAADQVAGCGAARFLAVARRRVLPAPLCDRRRGGRGALPDGPSRPSSSRRPPRDGIACCPGVAQRLGGGVDTHVTGLAVPRTASTVNRWYYRQRMEAALARTAAALVHADRPGQPTGLGRPAGHGFVGAARVTLTDACQRTTVTGIREPAADAQTIRPDANLLFVAGAGWTKKQADGQTHVKDAEQLIRDFLKAARASLGSSKSLVDLGGEGQAVLSFLTHLNQVGQTGSTPRHPKGLATCCHGEEPHTVGWRFINERRAINLDPNCGWARGKADVLYVADAFAVMAKVNELLGESNG